MSEIRATTISDAAGTGPITLTGQSAAKVYVNFDGDPVTIRESFNVGSITDNGTGDYTVNYTNAMGSVNYSWSTSGSEARVYGLYIPSGYSASVKRFNVKVSSTLSANDPDDANYQTFGDLA